MSAANIKDGNERTVVAVIGASGFIGSALGKALRGADIPIRLFGRSADGSTLPLDAFSHNLHDVRAVVHLAGVAHRKADAETYREVNTVLPGRLMHEAARQQVPRFVFMSSTRVHGRWSEDHIAPDSKLAPDTLFAQSKLDAETSLAEISGSSGVSLAIVRAPLVHGPGAPANFGLLLQAAARGLPLPLGRANAPRSLVGLANLTHALQFLAVRQTTGAPEILLPADPQDGTAEEVYRALCTASGKGIGPLPVPRWCAEALLTAAGRSDIYDIMFRPAVIGRAHWNMVGWRPPVSLAAGLRDSVSRPNL